MPMPAGVMPISEGRDPESEGNRTFYIRETLAAKLLDDVPWKYADADLLDEAIQANPPTTCFFGLKRDGFQDAYCYSTNPQNPPQPGVFLVFFYGGPEGFAGPTVIDWEWREEDPAYPNRPKDWAKDLGEPKWEK